MLADTSALLALALRRDQNHGPAVAYLRRHPDHRFVLTELILAELVTRVRARAGAAKAVEVARGLLSSRRYELVFLDRDLLVGALAGMERLRDKRLSLTDCASFELMRRLGLTGAFSFDRDFRDCGFEMVP
jgi:predicted nucleic acid-binding protein